MTTRKNGTDDTTELATHKLHVDAAFFQMFAEVFPVDELMFFFCPSVYICLSGFFSIALMSELTRKATDAHEKSSFSQITLLKGHHEI